MLEDAPIHRWLHSADGARAAREALSISYPWLVHNTPLSALAGVAARGLVRHEPGVLMTPAAIVDRFGNRPPMLCFAPPLSPDPWHNLQQHNGPFMKLGVAVQDLQGAFGLDWSFPYNWNLAAVIERDRPNANQPSIFLDVVRRTNVVAYHDDIQPEVLRVWTKDHPIDRPSDWPLLTLARAEDYVTWDVSSL